MERMVVLRSTVNATVSVNYPQYGINRRWSKVGQPIAVPYQTVEQCLYENGFRRMIDSGILYIDDMQDKIDLGLEPDGATEPVNIITFNDKEMEYLLTEAPMDEFKERMESAPRLQVDNVIEYAINHDIVVMEKANYLKKLTGGKDILATITKKREVEDAERRAQEKAAQMREREDKR